MGGTPELKFYNTLTREKSVFVPIDASNVRLYVCGPTVYDFAHIGNARPAIVFDVLFRLLRQVYGPENVTYVRNITDVDDKINARALRDYPGMELNAAIRLVTEKTDNQYQKDVMALGCLEPTVQPRATDNIGQMISIIEALVEKGHAYAAAGEVLFDTKSMADYGQLSKRNLDEQQAGARVAVDVHKKNPGDFVLWKLSDADEPGWDSPWGRGRPGWHIECSAMSRRYLGDVFDIHGGGLDLIFPHHENEIAQSRCAHGTSVMANVWMHNGFLQVEGRKMSKSDGNFVTIAELLETDKLGGRTWQGEVLRLAMLMTHYREPIDFSVKRLEEAEHMLFTWGKTVGNSTAGRPSQRFIAAWARDLDSSGAIAELHSLRKSSPAALRASLEWLGIDITAFFAQFRTRSSSLIFDNPKVSSQHSSTNLTAAINALVQMRLELLKAKNFADADKVRDELSAKGVQLKDGKDAATGERVTTWEIKR
ncbi:MULTISPECIES: cysteine--tRNA ligase [Rhizobium]|uniref:Cysteine--tRNA ligase n=1 Tax=Rhizobium rhododendri TaxID=2506430 RepID=A0ABY8IJ12_9HYPH|nr:MULTISPECIES: cysteine--tRNA ligase [Rhizobium]MBZ5760178.1 cysteine--tRNA ligase [Rhizobium sp. VS19-DR96]MBZ5766341.1 cysteine--tRNA ligase [Rhizobium sp. VS19-DR129.2]MBZ5774316.1 cysteine--tRNA ligase [Rhizobium sp. VS19-DRK62.2]MBZ5785389.1 cysteine--tRNA ligase [Rhizobium sp. VS19-DR121]MBZ5802987.1 cysteine--tRNA ligase [Rhizobium sp. VS19-DR181]